MKLEIWVAQKYLLPKEKINYKLDTRWRTCSINRGMPMENMNWGAASDEHWKISRSLNMMTTTVEMEQWNT